MLAAFSHRTSDLPATAARIGQALLWFTYSAFTLIAKGTSYGSTLSNHRHH